MDDTLLREIKFEQVIVDYCNVLQLEYKLTDGFFPGKKSALVDFRKGNLSYPIIIDRKKEVLSFLLLTAIKAPLDQNTANELLEMNLSFMYSFFAIIKRKDESTVCLISNLSIEDLSLNTFKKTINDLVESCDAIEAKNAFKNVFAKISDFKTW